MNEKTKELSELTIVDELYKYILYNSKLLFEELELKNPIEIFTAYRYMYTRGYFSTGKTIVISNDVLDLPKLLGIDVINGKVVCRHISSLLTDIYNIIGIESYSGAVLYGEGTRSLKERGSVKLKFDEKYKEDPLEEIDDEKLRKKVKYILNFVRRLGIVIPNHAITYAKLNEKGYLLDATNCVVFKVSSKRKIISLIGPEIPSIVAAPILSVLFDDIKVKDVKRMKEILSLDTVSYDECRKLLNFTLTKCRKNYDTLEQFYNRNSQIYKEIGEESRKVKSLCQELIHSKKI